MIVRSKVIDALERKRRRFAEYLKKQSERSLIAQERLARFQALSAEQIEAKIDERNIPHPGARPTHEVDQADMLRFNFAASLPRQWQHQQDARAWALATLTGKPVIAVDGSQIAPTKEYSIAVGAIQVGWYINDHAEGGSYVKDVDFEVITPAEVEDNVDEAGRNDVLTIFPDWYLNQQRFVRECDKLVELMENWPTTESTAKGKTLKAKPLCLFDGSFIISFAGQMLPARARPYTAAVRRMLEASKRTRIPLLAFVDTTFSRDLAALIELVDSHTGGRGPTDASLLNDVLVGWGDRCPLFVCARDDTLSREGNADFYNDVVFTYMRLTAHRPPVRVEMPRWMLDEGVAEDAINILRAEAVVGNGYPWALETADALAVLSHEDRNRFYRLFDEFASAQGIAVERNQKAQSKLNRR